MTDDELELCILNEYIARHEEVVVAEAAAPQGGFKCALELDMRDVIFRLTGKEGASRDFAANLWIGRLTSASPGNPSGLLRRCSNSILNTSDHKYHARAFMDPINNAPSPAWDRIRELQPNLSIPSSVAPAKELEQKFGILFSPPQAGIDFDIWLADTEDPEFSIGVLFIDIDHFKTLNERYTETEVDKTILPEFQNLLKQLAANRGAAYRYGGEEFVVLLPNHNSEEIMAFAEKVR
ncbi:MAG: GGDEF domain-containing protein, partial [Proteobacteria bacterium]|nr:GGDEF domain-containing protein [Pseudomonadota bacterium]